VSGSSIPFRGKLLAPVLLTALCTTTADRSRLQPERAQSASQYDSFNCSRRGINWSGPYPESGYSDQLLNTGHMDIGVRIATSNRVWAQRVRRAMDFWSTVLDMDWYEVNDPKAATIQVVDGTSPILMGHYAQSQLPNWRGFHGLIAVASNEMTTSMAARDTLGLYIMAHEIGHLLGLRHNAEFSSLMYAGIFTGAEILDKTDLATLRKFHAVRPGIPLDQAVVSFPLPQTGRLHASRVQAARQETGSTAP